jgi:phage N-6-adenine-methyltransferase
LASDVFFSAKRDDWGTPDDLFFMLDMEYGFEIDVCANEENHKCDVYYTKEDDGLSKEWQGVCWCNPPYGRQISKWVKKAYESDSATVVMLLPARTDTSWFHNYVLPYAEIKFIRGRI